MTDSPRKAKSDWLTLAIASVLACCITGCGDDTSAGGGDGGNNNTNNPGGPYFPAGSWVYQRVDGNDIRLSADSDTVTRWLADNGSWGLGHMQIDFSLEVLQAAADTPYEDFEPSDEFYEPDCDQVPMPVPAGGAIEGEEGYACTQDGDCHLIVVDNRDKRLYEMWRADIRGNTFQGGCLAAWDMTRVYGPDGRGDQCTSADAAGFPIAPLLFTPEEVAAGAIDHAIRFILPNSRMRDGLFVSPATHAGAPSGPSTAPVYGSRWRLRADFDLSSLPNDGARTVARAMQEYGMVLADGGSVALTAQSDRFSAVKWSGLLEARDLDSIEPTDFEIIDTGTPTELTFDCVRTAY